jgi:hypothetical protein
MLLLLLGMACYAVLVCEDGSAVIGSSKCLFRRQVTIKIVLYMPWGRQDHLWPIFWLTVTLTASVKGEGILFRLRTMRHSAEFRLRAMPHTAEFRLRAMPHSAEFKISFICDSALCHLLWNSSQKFSCRLRAMRHSGESTPRYGDRAELRLRAMQHSAESIFVVESNRIELESICKTVFRGPRGTVWRKNQSSKISWDCPFYEPFSVCRRISLPGVLYCSFNCH